MSGTLRITGDNYASAVVKSWQDGFQGRQPNVVVKATLLGTGTGLAGLYTRTADLALMGRALTPVEHDAYTFAFNKAEPLGIEVMTGSLDKPGKSAALVVFVGKNNPIARLTLAQLDGIIGSEHRRGSENIRTWGQLGLTGEWADKPITAYVYDQKTDPGMFLDSIVTRDSSKWNWEGVKEFKDIAWNAEGFASDAGKQILDALAQDPYGIAVSSLRYSTTQVKPLELAEKAGDLYFAATAETLTARDYPLTRAITFFINRPPGKPADPVVKEFLRYVLSRDGQEAVIRDSGFLPLSRELVRAQLKKID